MVASKVRSAGAFRILDEANVSRKDGNSNIQGAKCRRPVIFPSIDKPSRDAKGKVLLSRKSLPVNAPAKPDLQAYIENGRMQSRRIALADIGNLDNKTSQQFTNRLRYKPKLQSRKDILKGPKKVKDEQSKVPQGLSTKSIGVSSNKSLLGNPKSSALILGKINLPVRRRTISEANIFKESKIDHSSVGCKISKITTENIPQARFFVRTQNVMQNISTVRRPVMKGSKVPRALMATKASNNNRIKTTRHSWNNDHEEHGKSSNHDNAMVSQECLKADGSNNSSDLLNATSTSGCKSRRRKSYTLSLLIRSDCDGLLKKDLLPNIDDITNPLEVVEYVEDIYQHYWTMEEGSPSPANYTEIRSEVTPKMRSILVNWLIEVHHKYQLMEETLFLMIELLNRLLHIVTIKKDELQLFGLTVLLLASKYEDYWHPKVDELITLSINQYTRDEMLATEWLILQTLQFRLHVPTPYVFMLRFLKAAQSDKKLEDLAFYLVELCLVENESLKYRPSLLCASAIFAARSNLKLSPPWTKLLIKHAHYEESQLRTCAEMMLRFQREAFCKRVKYTYQKYLKPDRSCVASIRPIKVLPP